ncbi:MAG: class I SAM-dependent methyltransferase [Candidatus Thorarchaeota archaeon]|nr:class I SAM-dependent methyltransferase [Candidatus Thorarchaeota archaeon]
MTRNSSSRITIPVQEITLEHIETKGLILDIGGGGEGLVSRIEGTRVCAVDIRMSEIREALIHGPPANWFVGDGQHLSFRDGVFDVVTLWFSLEYMSDWSIKKSVLKEAHRVLVTDGRLSILSSKIDEDCERLIFWGHFTLPDGSVSQTGYGVRGGQNQILDRVADLVRSIGFDLSSRDNGAWFEIQASKT